MEQSKPENKMEPNETENKIIPITTHVTNDFGSRKFIIDDRVVNKCINVCDRLKNYRMDKKHHDTCILDDAIELLQDMQETPYEEEKVQEGD